MTTIAPRLSNIGVDTGGTFTDLVVIDDSGFIRTDKAFSTPDAPERGIFDVLDQASAALNTSISEMLTRTDTFSHGTTVSTNALITRKGAKVGVLFTSGFEDTLAIGRGPIGRVGGLPQSRAMDFLHTEPPPPLVPSEMIRGICERMDAKGKIVIPLDKDSVRNAVGELLDKGAESFAVCLLWAFQNPRHEQQIGSLIQGIAGDIPVSLSYEIAPRMGEYERAVTTIINAYVGPITQNYIRDLDAGLSARGLSHPVQIVTSAGGATRATDMNRQAVSVINSGPVAGLVAARFVGDQLGHSKIITADMGGTSFDVGLINGETLEEDPQPFLDQGLPVSLPTVKLVTIGAGGGSIAWTDGYRLQVGPQSAGANPGPAAYGRDGAEPTVTDALVVSGIIDPKNFFGGKFQLDPDLAAKAIAERIARPLKMSVQDAAAGILDIVNARMANLIRKVSIESGHDPADFALYAYGGATGAHCAEFAKQLGISKLILPYAGPVFSALGVAITDIRYSHSRSEPVLLGNDAVRVINRNLAKLRDQTRNDMIEAGFDPSGCQYRYRIDLRYQGQMNEVTLEWASDNVKTADLECLRKEFENLYERRFGVGTIRAGSPMEIITFRVDATRSTNRPVLAKVNAVCPASHKSNTRQIYLRNSGHIEASVINFRTISPDSLISGPAILERDTTTIWIPPGCSARMDSWGNIEVNLSEAS
ncbi:MAG: Acetophenone carboxylase gamma subunit [Alphaproteobacteria bacterium MarineAlpha11_Bin1]|nr:MAG: Acetophenone carboxylase gamma subunit [Alphaproteobacteria bacterium MarineAlpha11_Bin1]